MKLRFREKPVIPIFLVGLVLLFVGIPASFQLANLPFIKGTSYEAEFAESGGLSTFDAVRVAGVVVGKIEEIKLDGDKVVVKFTAKDVDLGEETTAKISTDTLLGERGLTIEPKGEGKMDGGDTIPLSRTTAPYNVADRIEQSTTTVQQIDKNQLETAMNVFADTFAPLPEEFAATFDTVSRLSQTVSSRDEELRNLLKTANSVSKVFQERTADFERLLINGNQLFAALEQRRADYRYLLQEIEYVATQINEGVKATPGISTAVNELRGVLDILRRNEGNITVALQRAAGFAGGLGEGISMGPWFAGNLALPTPVVPLHEFLPQMVGLPPNTAGGGVDAPAQQVGEFRFPGIPGVDVNKLLGGN